MGIFVKIGHTTAQIVTYWPERIGPAFPTLWSGHDFGQKKKFSHSLITQECGPQMTETVKQPLGLLNHLSCQIFVQS